MKFKILIPVSFECTTELYVFETLMICLILLFCFQRTGFLITLNYLNGKIDYAPMII